MRVLGVFVLTILCLVPSTVLAQKTLSWRLFGNLHQARWRYEVQPLSKDKLLIMGGHIPNNTTTNTCEFIDLKNYRIDLAPSMHNIRTYFATILDKDSNIYVFGGFTGEKTIAGVEFYSKTENKWYQVGSMAVARHQHSVVLIDDHRVLIACGRDINDETIQSAEIFDLKTRKSRFIAPFPTLVNNGMFGRTSNASIILFGGRAGGHGSKQSPDVIMFEPSSETWKKIDTLPVMSTTLAFTTLFDGSTIYSGGKNELRKNDWLTDVVLEKDNKFSIIAHMQEGRHCHWIAQLDETRIITGGGLKTWSGKSSKTTDIISLTDDKQQNGPEMLFARKNAKAVSIPIMKDGKIIKPRILVISGVDDKFLNSIEILDETPQISGIINTYTKVTQILGKHSSQIKVKSTDGFSIGDKVLIMQMQGARANYGVTQKAGRQNLDYRNTGNHGFARIAHINGNIIALERQLTHPYSVDGKVQLIRVPEYSDVVVNGELTCKPWDGETGGVLAFNAYGTVTINDNINVNGKGFRGGKHLVNEQSSVLFADQSNTQLLSSDNEILAFGEGIAINDKATYGKETIGNGGGPGVSNNAGGANISCGGDGSIGWVSEYSLLDNAISKGGLPLDYNGKRVFMGGGGGAGHSDDGKAGNGGNGGGIIFISAKNIFGNNFSISASGMNGIESSSDGSGGGGAGGCVYLDIEELNQELYVYASGGNGGNNVISQSDEPATGSGGGGGGGTVLFSKPISNIITYTNGGISGISASVFSENKAQDGCHGIVMDNVKIVDGSDNTHENNRFIKDCLNEDCSEYAQNSNVQFSDTTEIDYIGNHEYEATKGGFLYPNPASDILTVSTVETNNLTIFDSIGNIHQPPFTESQLSVTFDVSSLQNGVYFIRNDGKTLSFVIKR